jgi:hypothetical protein
MTLTQIIQQAVCIMPPLSEKSNQKHEARKFVNTYADPTCTYIESIPPYHTAFDVINLSFSIHYQRPSILVTAPLSNAEMRKSVILSWPWDKTGDGRCILTCLNVCPLALLIVKVNTILITTCLLSSLEGTVGSDGHN